MRHPFALALLVLLVAPSAGAENLNVDLGTHWGTPPSSFGAAPSQAGTWNEVGLSGSAGLLDLSGVATSVSISVTALADTGWTGTGSDDPRRLVEDNIHSSGGGSWNVTVSGLAHGAYDLYLYAPAHSSVSSGDLSIDTWWHSSIPGTWSGSFVEGTNTLRVSVLVADGQISISSGFGTTLGLAGLQLVEVPYLAGFNVDLGSQWGTPSDGFGAASGQTGPWNEIGLAGSAGLTDTIGRATATTLSVTATVGTGWTGTGSNDAEVLVEDNVYGTSGSGWTLAFSGLPLGPYDIYLHAPAHTSVPSGALSVAGQPAGSIPGTFSGTFVEGTNFVRVRVYVGAGALTLTGSGPGLTGLAGVQIVPVRSAPKLNVDLGTHYGVPDDSYGAAGVPGHWELVGLGSHAGLRDASGAATATSVTVTADSDTSWTTGGATNAELLFDDSLFSSGTNTWSAHIGDLPPGRYEVTLYAPAHSAVPSGPISVNGKAVSELPGDTGEALIEGTSWASVIVEAPEGRIEIDGGGVSSSGLAGFQLAPAAFQATVPALGPLGVAGLVLALVALGTLGARRIRAS